MKSDFEGLIAIQLYTAEKRICEHQDRSTETTQVETETKVGERDGRRTGHPIAVGNSRQPEICVSVIQKEKRKQHR